MQLSGESHCGAQIGERLGGLVAPGKERRGALAGGARPAGVGGEAVTTGYAARPGLAERATEPVVDPATGRTMLRLLPRFDAITYREVWARAGAIAADWRGDTP